jgi:hypothetical protein
MGARTMLVLLAVIALPAVGLGANFFVSTSGNNAWPGTSAQPWRTLQYAADEVAPGDRVTVRPGNYVGFNLFTSGTPAAPIEFLADSGVNITQPNSFTDDDGINLEGASHIVIDGFSVVGMPRAGVRSVGFPS